MQYYKNYIKIFFINKETYFMNWNYIYIEWWWNYQNSGIQKLLKMKIFLNIEIDKNKKLK